MEWDRVGWDGMGWGRIVCVEGTKLPEHLKNEAYDFLHRQIVIGQGGMV